MPNGHWKEAFLFRKVEQKKEVFQVNVNKLKMRETLISYAFLAPVLVFFVIFVLIPMIMGFVTSFFNYSMTEFTFVGFANYARMFQDPIFMKSLINTLIIVIGSVPVVVFFSLFFKQKNERSCSFITLEKIENNLASS